jgi:hypothetical protein
LNRLDDIEIEEISNDWETMKEQVKQETLEEAFEKFMETNFCGQLTKGFVLGAMKFGAKWQQNRSYSEEDMKRAFCNGGQLDYSALTSTEFGTKILNKWFETFKKK